MKPKPRTSVLGLNVAEGHLYAARAVRTKGNVTIEAAAAAPFALDVLQPDAEPVGRAIKQPLEAAGLRETACVVAIPARWVMTQHTKLPDLGPEDAASFLQLEAEKGFPVDPDQLMIVRSMQRSTDGTHVTQLAVRRDQIEQLATAVKAAGLKPISFSLGLAALPGAIPPAGSGRITVAAEAGGVTMLVAAGGGVAAFRTCESHLETEAGERVLSGAAIVRELRLTFEQVAAELRAEVKQLCLIGDPALVRQLNASVTDWAKSAGLALQPVNPSEKSLAADLAASVARHVVEVGGSALEFLPPLPSRWSLLLARYNAKRLGTVGFAVAAIAVVTLLAFGWQEFRRWSLSSEWGAMQAQVTMLDGVQARIREYRPFYDTSFRTLTIMRRVTECFPDNGSVSAKTFELHGATVTVSGQARDNAALLRTLEALRKVPEVQALKVEQIRGKTPATFNFTFHWNATSGT